MNYVVVVLTETLRFERGTRCVRRRRTVLHPAEQKYEADGEEGELLFPPVVHGVHLLVAVSARNSSVDMIPESERGDITTSSFPPFKKKSERSCGRCDGLPP